MKYTAQLQEVQYVRAWLVKHQTSCEQKDKRAWLVKKDSSQRDTMYKSMQAGEKYTFQL